MTSLANLITGRRRPRLVAVSSAVKADVHRIIERMDIPDNGAWPGTEAGKSRNAMHIDISRDLLADVLDANELAVIDAVLQCRAHQIESLFRDVDETEAAELLRTVAEELARATEAAITQHMNPEATP